MSTTTMTSKGQVTIPKDVRERLRLRTGDKLCFQVEEDGSARIRPVSLRPADVFGMLSGRVRGAATLKQIDAGVAEALRKGEL